MLTESQITRTSDSLSVKREKFKKYVTKIKYIVHLIILYIVYLIIICKINLYLKKLNGETIFRDISASSEK